MKVVAQENLWFKEGSSDKIYNVVIEEVQRMYVVNFSYGRSGNALQTGTKTNEPVTFFEAEKIFNKLVSDKTKKGYRISASNTPTSIQVIAPTEEIPVSKCVLLNAITEEQAEELINDDDWVLQEKMDGVRYMLEFEGIQPSPKFKGYNRKCKEVPVSEEIKDVFESFDQHLPPDCFLDGELIGETFYVFDILSMDSVDLREESYEKRYSLLAKYSQLYFLGNKYIKLVRAYGKKEEKEKLFTDSKAKEGVVFKRKSAKYHVGRPASGGDYLKFKFWQSCSCIVTKVNSKRSVSIGLMGGIGFANNVICVGNVTIPANLDIPKVGAVAEVKYLYAFRGGSLFQPVYLGQRFFEVPVDAIQTIKYKEEGSED